jgi:antitoxin component of MazEF toxin-antitoxin module
MKSLYVLQPYHVGSKYAKSLALVIPAEVVKEYNLNISTVFALRVEQEAQKITLQIFNNEIHEQISVTPTGGSLQASDQQASTSIQ